jgi:tetratricopeptide (TPR) repeat protein
MSRDWAWRSLVFAAAVLLMATAISCSGSKPPPQGMAMEDFDRGGDAADKGEFDLAISCFTEAIRLNPADDQAYYNRAVCYWQKKEIDRALSDLDEALRLDPK